MLKEKLGMNPLCITIRPPLEDPVGIENINNFLDRGYHHVMIHLIEMLKEKLIKIILLIKGYQCTLL